MVLTRKMNSELQAILEAIASTNSAIATVKNDIAASQESTNAAIASTNAAIATVKNDIAASKEEMNSAIATVKGEMVTAINEKFRDMSDKIAGMDYKVDSFERRLLDVEKKISETVPVPSQNLAGIDAKVDEKIITIKDDFEKRLLDMERKISETTMVSAHGVAPSPISRLGIKLSTFDGKASWSVYKTQLEMVANANGWDDRMKAIHLAASLREEAAEVLQTLPADKRNNLEELVKALDLRFGDCALKDFYRLQLKTRSQKNDESLQELAADIERLSSLAFPECPTDVRDSLSLQYFLDALRDPEIQQALRIADYKDLRSALIYARTISSVPCSVLTHFGEAGWCQMENLTTSGMHI